MPFRFKKSNCIAVGSFNIYIFPEWVRRMSPFPAGVEMHVHNDLSRPGLKLFSPHLTLSWTIRPDKITIESESPNDDCGQIMDRVFETLPWTPLQALGNNFYFEAPTDEVCRLNGSHTFLAAQTPIKDEFTNRGWELALNGWHLALKRDNCTCGIQLTLRSDCVRAAANFHTELGNRTNASAREAARSFETDRLETGRLLQELLGASIENGNVNIGQ